MLYYYSCILSTWNKSNVKEIQHQAKYLQDNSVTADRSTSWMKEHQLKCHDGAPEKFKMEVLQVFKDALSRQISEAVHIENAIRSGYDVSNDKSEWHSASLVSVMSEVQTEIRRNPGGWLYRCNNPNF